MGSSRTLPFGFSPHRLAELELLRNYETISSGYYAYESGDVALMNVFRNRTYSKVKGSSQFTLGFANAMNSALDVLGAGTNMDSEPYFERPAWTFRLLLKKVRCAGFLSQKWSSLVFRKTEEIHGQQATKARRDCHEVKAG